MIKPLNDKIVILPDDAPEKSAGGIILAGNKEKPTKGLVVAVGAGRVLDNGTRVKPEVEVGNQVVYGQYVGTEIEIDGKKHRIVSEGDILAVFAPAS